MTFKLNSKDYLLLVLSTLIISDLSISLDIPLFRQIFGYFLVAFFPGILIVQLLDLDETELTESLVLAVGISISSIMILGLLFNYLLLHLGFDKPLSTKPLLILFNLEVLSLIVLTYTIHKNKFYYFPQLKLTVSEKIYLIIPSLFPAISLFGIHVMNIRNNNLIMLFLFILISAYVIGICLFNDKFPKKLYPSFIFLISFSLLLIYMLRFPHINGHDVHHEFYIFSTIFDKLYWSLLTNTLYDSTLSISILPVAFESIINLQNQEFLFKSVYVIICAFCPLAIYVISKRYIDELYAFLASFFFVAQSIFLTVAGNPRTSIAIFFVAVSVMVLFNEKISLVIKRFLFIIFILSVVLSHYSTTYIFFLIIFSSYLILSLLSSSKKYVFDINTSFTVLIIFFAFIFIWYSQITEIPFRSGMRFISHLIGQFNSFFVEESRSVEYTKLFGKELAHPIISKINLAVTWASFLFIGFGLLNLVYNYKNSIISSYFKSQKLSFLTRKFEIQYIVIACVCCGLLLFTVISPYVSIAYGIQRLYSLLLVFLSVCFVIGGISISNYFKLRPFLLILIVLIPYFMFVTGAMNEIVLHSGPMTLNSKAQEFDLEYVYDSESCSAKWLKQSGQINLPLYTTDPYITLRLISQGLFNPLLITNNCFSNKCKLDFGYIYLGYNNVINGKLVVNKIEMNMSEYTDIFIGTNKIYNNNISEIYFKEG